MNQLDRRSMLAFGVVGLASAAPLITSSNATASERYGADEGEEVFPGIRQIDIAERDSIIPGYATVVLSDYVYQPGSSNPPMPMENDMVCHMLEGELEVVLDGEEFTVSEGGVWTCAEGSEEGATNATDRVVIMRVTHLHAA